jgi:hypothetical protein
MTRHKFIFSNEPGFRLARHLAFWCGLLLHFIIQNLIVGGANEAHKPRSFEASAYYAIFFFPVYCLYVYFFLYILIPVFLFRHRYAWFVISLIVLLLMECVVCYFTGLVYIHFTYLIPFNQITFDANKYNTIVNGLFFPATIFAIAGGIKLAKKWYLELKENERLAREKISRELQLVKIQLHPRFLFHALDTVKMRILSWSPSSGQLLIRLSELLSYILYESDTQYVLIDKEVDAINNYIDFEKDSISGGLATEISISENTENIYISPLLLLSFLETSFDCFSKNRTKDPSLKLTITVWNDHLDYHLICNRFLDGSVDPVLIKTKFFRLEKQLYYLYPGNHQLEVITNLSDITIVLNLPVFNASEETNKNMIAQFELHD